MPFLDRPGGRRVLEPCARLERIRHTHMRMQPLGEWTKGSQVLDDLGLGACRRQPCWCAELSMRGERLVAQQIRSRVLRWVTSREPNELMATDLETSTRQFLDRAAQGRTGHIVCHCAT